MILAHIVRIGPPVLRKPLLLLWFPVAFLGSILFVLRIGKPFALLHHRFYELPWQIFWHAWDGGYVP